MFVTFDEESGVWKVVLAVRKTPRGVVALKDAVLDTGFKGLCLTDGDESEVVLVCWEGKLCKARVRSSTTTSRLGCVHALDGGFHRLWGGGPYHFRFRGVAPQFQVGSAPLDEETRSTNARWLSTSKGNYFGIDYCDLKLHDPGSGHWCDVHMSGTALFHTGSKRSLVLIDTPQRGFNDWDGVRLTLTDGEVMEWGEIESGSIESSPTFDGDVRCNMIWGVPMIRNGDFHFDFVENKCRIRMESVVAEKVESRDGLADA